ALETLLNDFHVQQPEKAATESKSQCVAGFGLELETRIVDAQFRQCVAQLFEILAVGWIQPAIHHALRRAIALQWLRGIVSGHAHGISDVYLAERLDVANQIAYLAGLQLFARPSLWYELTQLQQVVGRAGPEESDFLSFLD